MGEGRGGFAPGSIHTTNGAGGIHKGVRFFSGSHAHRKLCAAMAPSLTNCLYKRHRDMEVRQTEVFADWFAGLRDREARAPSPCRIRRLSLGNPAT